MNTKKKWIQWMVGLASIGTLVFTTGLLQAQDKSPGVLQPRGKSESVAEAGQADQGVQGLFEEEAEMRSGALPGALVYEWFHDDGHDDYDDDHDDDEHEHDEHDDEKYGHSGDMRSRARSGGLQPSPHATTRPS